MADPVSVESSRARQALDDYLRLGPTRSLPLLVERYRSGTEANPPTRRLTTLRDWSRCYDWQRRAAAHDAEREALRRRAESKALEAEAAETARQVHAMGHACLALAAAALTRYVDPATGTLKESVSVREIAALVKVGVGTLAAASELLVPPVDVWGMREWENALEAASPEERRALVEGLRAARALRRRMGDI
jgi:hypothetical protein